MKIKIKFKRLLAGALVMVMLAVTACGEEKGVVAEDDSTLTQELEQSGNSIEEETLQNDQSEKLSADSTSQNTEDASEEQAGAESKKDSGLVTDSMEVHFIDVGQGDATLIKCGEHAMLIDAGENDKGTTVQLYLQKQGVKKLDYVIGTHPDSDHIGGLDVIIYKLDCNMIMMPDYAKDTRTYDDVIQAMKSKSYKNTSPIVGNEYTLGDATFTIIAPNNYNYGNESNNYSVGILLKHGDNTFIFTGDAEEEAETDILANGIDVSADVYQVGHHGSATASSQAFLNAVSPTYAVISCGEDNSYGHPHAETLNKLRAMGVQVFRTDEQGSIVATSDGSSITWNTAPSDTWKSGENVKNSTKSASSSTANKTTSSNTTEKPGDSNQSGTADKNSASQPVVQEPAATTSAAQTYICNTNTKKFHYPSCGSVSQMKESNKQEVTTTREDLISMGYEPCKKCNP